MVALDTAARSEAAPRARARRASSGWLLGTAAVLVLGSCLPLLVQPGIGHLSAAVLSLLLGTGAAAVGLALGSPRAAFVASLAVMLLLGVGRLPPRAAPGFDEPQALWQTDQTIDVRLTAAPDAPHQLAVFTDAIFSGDQAPYGVVATVNGRPFTWQCPFQHGHQWLQLPLGSSTPSTLDIRLGLSGSPSRELNYLVVYHSTSHDGYLVGLTEDVQASAPAPVTTCSPA